MIVHIKTYVRNLDYYVFQITDDEKNVFAAELPVDHLDQTSRNMYNHIRMLIEERDTYHDVSYMYNHIRMLIEERDTYHDVSYMYNHIRMLIEERDTYHDVSFV